MDRPTETRKSAAHVPWYAAPFVIVYGLAVGALWLLWASAILMLPVIGVGLIWGALGGASPPSWGLAGVVCLVVTPMIWRLNNRW